MGSLLWTGPRRVHVWYTPTSARALRCRPKSVVRYPLRQEGMTMAMFDNDDPDAGKKMRALFGPGQVDQCVRQAIQMCWMMLPDGGKSTDELEKQFRRIVNRAIKDLRDDAQAFGIRE